MKKQKMWPVIKRWSIKTDREMIQMLELLEMGFKIIIETLKKTEDPVPI